MWLLGWVGDTCASDHMWLCASQVGRERQDSQKTLEMVLWADTGALGPGGTASRPPT